jgi:predicted MPP superfamily phosphohydrolase
LKVVFAADFHLGERTAAGFMKRFVNLANAQKPDVVLIGGDVFEGDRRNQVSEEREAEFRRLRATYGVFGVLGNHERYGRDWTDSFAKAGIRLLQDEVVRVDEAFILAGRKDARFRNRMSVQELLGGTPDDLPVILLDHRPTDLENASRSIADIQLSGHTHHGQLFPANLVTQHLYELDWGYKKKRNTHIFVTSGIQLWGPPVRTVGSSEMLVIDVTFR